MTERVRLKNKLKLEFKHMLSPKKNGEHLNLDKLAELLAELDVRVWEIERRGAAVSPAYVIALAFFSVMMSVLITLSIIPHLMAYRIL